MAFPGYLHLYFSIFIQQITYFSANSVNPEQTPRSVASDLHPSLIAKVPFGWLLGFNSLTIFAINRHSCSIQWLCKEMHWLIWVFALSRSHICDRDKAKTPTSQRSRLHIFACTGPYDMIQWKLYSSLRKHAYSNILRILPPKNENFQMKNSDSFHISTQNIHCGYLLEPPRRGGSNEYPQSIFLSRNKKINVYPCNPIFTA